MGAILAILGEAGDPELGGRLQRMIECSPYRGEPDFLVEGPLAIGIQSMGWDASLHSEGNWIVAFHGYIGNWGELAPSHGWAFPEGAGNANKIGIAYEALGDDLFTKLRGEWAVVILNRHRRELIAARDVVGCRPLFRSAHAGRLILASEIRQIHAGADTRPAPNEDALAAHLARCLLTDGQTTHKGVFRVLPARVHRCRLALPNVGLDHTEYWWPSPEERRARRDLPALADEARHVIEQAVLRSLPSRPFLCTLSGGMDSGSIWGTVLDLARRGEPRAANGRTVSLVYPGLNRDESAFIRTHSWLPDADPIFIDGSAGRSVDHLDEMTNALDALHEGTLFEVRYLNLAGYVDDRRVVLCGVGGDEWFSGRIGYLFDLIRHGRLAIAVGDGFQLAISPRWGIRRTVRAFFPPNFSPRRLSSRPPPPPAWLHRERHDLYRHLQLQQLFGSSNRDSAYRSGLLRTMANRQCTDDLVSIDQISSQCGVEERFPLMDLDLIEFVMRTDGQAFIAGERTKYLMRTAMRGTLPEAVLNRTMPTFGDETVARGLPELAAQSIDEDWYLTRLRILDPEVNRNTLDMAAHGKIEYAAHVYSLFAAEWFARKHVVGGFEGIG